jgi:group II intron reverse transcriptase/maturase
LGIPNVIDRIVQMALLILLQPIFEADFDEASFGYRPGRKAQQALDVIRNQLRYGRTEVIDADLSGYFDTIDHAGLLRLVAHRVSDGSILRLVKRFLKAPIAEEKKGRRSYHPNDRGTPQGGVLSPLLANLYLNSLDHGVNDHPQLDAKLIRYADDFVLLCRSGQGAAMLERLKGYVQAKRLTLNETKTRLVNFRQEPFRFLGFDCTWRRSPRTGNHFVHVAPSQKARRKLRDAVREELSHWTKHRSCAEAVRRVNQITRGWAQCITTDIARTRLAASKSGCETDCADGCGESTVARTASSVSSPTNDGLGNINSGPCPKPVAGADSFAT